VSDNCRRIKGVWMCFGGGGRVLSVHFAGSLILIFST
jgi:hypothetical protein